MGGRGASCSGMRLGFGWGLFGCCSGFYQNTPIFCGANCGIAGVFRHFKLKEWRGGKTWRWKQKKLALGGNFSYTIPLLLILCVEE
jgi:hypothetical protein